MREVCNAEWDDIQDRLKEKDAEIERLQALCARAAEVLEKYTSYPIGMVMSVTLRESGRSVLAELRKAGSHEG